MLEGNFEEMAERTRCSLRRVRRVSVVLIYLFVFIHQGHGLDSIYDNAEHYWPMKNISDNTSLDVVGLTHASIQNGAEVNNTSLFGPAVILDGKDDFIMLDLLSEDCTNTPSKCFNGFTISFWLYYIRGEFILCTGTYMNGNKGPGIKLTYDEKQELLVLQISTVTYTWKFTSPMPRRSWEHVAFTWSMDDGIQMYRNGGVVQYLQSTKKMVVFERPRNSRGWSIGRPNEVLKLTSYGNLGISHLAVWLRELTKVEVFTAYVETLCTRSNIAAQEPPTHTTNDTMMQTKEPSKDARSATTSVFTCGKYCFVKGMLLILCNFLYFK